MGRPIHRVTAFQIVGWYTLAVSFSDGTEQRIDFEPVLRGPLLGPLLEPAHSSKLCSTPRPGHWYSQTEPTSIPTTLHDWPEVRDELVACARTWTDLTSDGRADRRMEPTRR
jgi:hypothetical protein